MRQLYAFLQKEWMELTRSGRLLILAILALLFGIMNPAIAKLTPWIMEMAAGSLEGSGLVLTEVTVDALTSWTQFYKNMPILLIIVLLMFSGSFTNEYQKGTFINMVTKGLSRWKIVVSKLLIVVMGWSLVYWGCFGITYGYNAYFWDNGIAENISLAAICYYVMGVWLISLLVLFSTIASGNIRVVLGVGAVYGICYLLSMFGNIKEFLPTQLSFGMTMLAGVCVAWEKPLIVSVLWGIINIGISIILFNRRKMC